MCVETLVQLCCLLWLGVLYPNSMLQPLSEQLSLLLWLQEDIKHITGSGSEWLDVNESHVQCVVSHPGDTQPVPKTFPGNVHGLSVSCRHGFLLAGLPCSPPAASVPFQD